MGKFDGVLICTDLDGTLFRDDKTVSKENRDAISFFKREGGFFTFITGRMPYYSVDAYRAAQPNTAFGCINGGGLYDGEKGEYIWKLELPTAVWELVRYVDAHFPLVGIEVCGFENSYVLKENETMAWHRTITKGPHLTCGYDLQIPMAKIIFGSECDEELLAIECALQALPRAREFALIRTEKRLFEILPYGVDKGLALTKLAEHLHISPEKTVAIGDYNNDVAMLRAAGLGVAVANACKAALDAADLVTVSNEEHAIAAIISDLANGACIL